MYKLQIMKYSFLVIFFAITSPIFAQKTEDSKIIIKVTDTTELAQRVRTALIRSNFVVKDLPGDTVSTYPKDMRNMNGFMIAFAILSDTTVTISGFYNVRMMDDFGYTKLRKYYKQVRYFRGSKTWPVLSHIASLIPGTVEYQ